MKFGIWIRWYCRRKIHKQIISGQLIDFLREIDELSQVIGSLLREKEWALIKRAEFYY